MSKLNVELSDQPSHIRAPTTLKNMMTALTLFDKKLSDKAQIQAEIKAQNITVHQRSGYSDPTSTVAGKNVATVNFGYQNRQKSNNYNKSNKGKRKPKIHSYKECNNKARCRIHAKKGNNNNNSNNNSQYNSKSNYNNNNRTTNWNKNNNRYQQNQNQYGNQNQQK